MADVFHSSHFRFSILGKAKNVTTVHDLIYERGLVSPSFGAKINLYERKVSYHTADAIICISENTKNDLLQVYPALKDRCPIHVVYHGFSQPSYSVSQRQNILPCGSPYILYVGVRGGYKNFNGALEGYRNSGVWREGIKLVCTGKRFEDAEREHFSRIGLEGLVLNEENVTAERLYDLYSNAFCLLYTSTYEGFGLPPLEAMSCGCPVIASNASSIPEVIGNAGILVNSLDSENVGSAVNRLQDSIFRQKIIEAGYERSKLFSWDKSAKEHLRVYKEASALK
jgi:mannosyltransferase